MKLTKSKLKQIIKEELTKIVREDQALEGWEREDIPSRDFETGEDTIATTWTKNLNPRERAELRQGSTGWQWSVWELFRNPDPEERDEWEVTVQSAQRDTKVWDTAREAIADLHNALKP